MKKTISILAGVATLSAAIYASSRLWAQQGGYAQQGAYQAQPTAAAQPRTRVALINLGQIIKNYQKFKNFEEQLKNDTQWYQKEIDKRKVQMQQLTTDSAKMTDTAQREQAERQMKTLQREVQDYTEDAKTKLSKREFDALVQTYREIQDAVGRYAKANDVELVMEYNDAIGNDVFSPPFFSRKLTNNACVPMYAAPGMDITGVVVEMLNRSMAATTPAAPAPTPGGNN